MSLPYTRSLLSGAVGACALTLLHETARRRIPQAPRADVLGMRAIAKVLRFAGRRPPHESWLHKWALLGDLISNTLYYSTVGRGEKQGIWRRGAALGLSAGLGAVALPGPLKLGKDASNRTTATQVMTVAWYLAGGLAAAATANFLASDSDT